MKKIPLMLLAAMFMIPVSAWAQADTEANKVLSDKTKKKISATIIKQTPAAETLKIINEAAAIPEADAFIKAYVFPFAKHLKQSKEENPSFVLQAVLTNVYEPLVEKFASNKKEALNGAVIEPTDKKALDAVVKVLNLPLHVGWSKEDIKLADYLNKHVGNVGWYPTRADEELDSFVILLRSVK